MGRARRRLLVAALTAVSAVACGGGDSLPGPLDAPAAGVPAACTGPAPRSAAGSTDWPTYQRTPERQGVDGSSPALGTLRGIWGTRLDGPVYAQPLVVGGVVVAATESDSIYALDARSGCVLWRTQVGEPFDARVLACGNIPTIGITATPVVDPAAAVIYAIAYTTPGRHQLVALDLGSGAIRWSRPADPPGSDPLAQLSRPALTLANGRVYFAFGGRAGDCGDFHGYVVGVRSDGTGEPVVYTVPAHREGGIWAPPGATLLPGGDLLVAVGNGESETQFDGGNSVVRLSPDLRLLDQFAAPDWAHLNHLDFDLGSVGPTLLDGGLVFQVGKAGQGYLLDPQNLGGIGGQRFSASLDGCYAIGATAYLAPLVFVPCDHGVKAVRVEGDSFSVAWRGPDFRSGSPIVAGGALFDEDFEGGMLWALDPQTGHVLLRIRTGVAQHFVAPSASAGRLFAPVGESILAFDGV